MTNRQKRTPLPVELADTPMVVGMAPQQAVLLLQEGVGYIARRLRRPQKMAWRIERFSTVLLINLPFCYISLRVRLTLKCYGIWIVEPMLTASNSNLYLEYHSREFPTIIYNLIIIFEIDPNQKL